LGNRYVLPLGAVAALVWANTFALGYAEFAHAWQFAVNDVGMTLFFGLAAKEVVEATAPGGALHTWRRASLPVASAAGGMIVPALLYMAVARLSNETLLIRGWAIPCATDIAFGYLAARAIFGARHPAVSFLLLLAIVDDALGLIVLAVWYPVGELHLLAGAALMAAALAASAGLRGLGVKSVWPYLLVGGPLSWTALWWGGIHPALALVPIMPFLPHAGRDLGLFVEAPAAARDALSQFEHATKYPIQAVLFAFALVNAGVRFQDFGTGTWAVLGALLVGKPAGIMLTSAAAVALGLRLPQHLSWRDLFVVGFVAAIGFTVALFFATAAFSVGPMLGETKIGALLSLSAAAVAMGAAKVLRTGRFSAAPRHP
jgi:Na+:H+ antiporter, NhaA family